MNNNIMISVRKLLVKDTVTRVLDGDTIEISTGERVRFIGVDAPEIGAVGGVEATEFVRNLILGKNVWLEADGRNSDGRGRLRRYVWLRLPTDTGDRVQIMRYQLNALLLSHSHAKVLIVGNVRNEALFYELANIVFVGTVSSKVLHLIYCRSAPAERNRRVFSARREAIVAGYRTCKHYKP